MLQRDAFITEIVKKLNEGKELYFLDADFGAAALDEMRANFSKNFIHCGISEQAMIDVATGLALEGKQVFCYAMAPFLSLRALEQIKCGPGIMSLPITLISVGIGLGYADSGPTHYSTEDYACLRAIVGSTIYTPSDTPTASLIAKQLLDNPTFAYVRLDRQALPVLSTKNELDVNKGFRIIGSESVKKIALISHGKLVHACAAVTARYPDKFYTIDLFRSKPFPKNLFDTLDFMGVGVLVLDEQTPSGSLGSAVLEAFAENGISLPTKILTLPEKYIFENNGRERSLEIYGLSEEGILKASTHFSNRG
jgi:transketolase